MSRPSPASVVISATLMLGATVLSSSATADGTVRQKEVAQRGAEAMPFSLAATTHVFTKTADGGIQQVISKHPDSKQVAQIREHLATISRQFSQGDFQAPAQIHGNTMPGLASLRAARPGELMIRYRDLPSGGEIAYRTANPQLVAALHQWFDAQLSDHGHDAMAGHHPRLMHPHPLDSSATQ